MSKYTPTEHEVRLVWSEWSSYGGLTDRPDYDATRTEMRAEFDRFIARVRRDASREALDGLSAWLGDLAEKHPARSAHVPLMQGHITRYTTDNYPEGDDQ